MNTLSKICKRTKSCDNDENSKREFYFSYGSNMCPNHLTKCKKIEPYSIRRGIIKGYRLSFSCCISTNKSDPSFANIVAHKIKTRTNNEDDDEEDNKSFPEDNNNNHDYDPYVNGSIIEIAKNSFDQLDGYEYTYVRKQLKAVLYDEDGGGELIVWTYIMDKKHEISLNKKYPSQKYEFKEKPPSKNYMKICIEGAKSLGLHDEYIEFLLSQKVKDYIPLSPSNNLLNIINKKSFTMNEIKNYRKGGPLMVFKGIVFDLHKSPKYFQTSYGGKDITLIQALRWVHANKKNTKSIKSLENDQKLFVNHVLMGALLGGSILGVCVGKLSEKEKYGYNHYKW